MRRESVENLRIEIVPKKILRDTATNVLEGEFGDDLDSHMEDMLQLMRESGGVGLAGPQVGDSRRLLVVDSEADSLGPLKMINPVISEKSNDSIVTEEGCLSTPGFFIEVERSSEISVKYRTPNGDEVEERFSQPNSIIIQHEIDHLDGVTILDKASRLKRDIYLRKVNKYRKKLNRALKKMKSMTY